MGFTPEALNQALCYFSIKAGKESHTRSLPKLKAEKGLEAFVKAVYGALFDLIVQRINSSITAKSDGKKRGGSQAGKSIAATIGVLDIFGFESFKTNSFVIGGIGRELVSTYRAGASFVQPGTDAGSMKEMTTRQAHHFMADVAVPKAHGTLSVLLLDQMLRGNDDGRKAADGLRRCRRRTPGLGLLLHLPEGIAEQLLEQRLHERQLPLQILNLGPLGLFSISGACPSPFPRGLSR